MRFHKNVGWLFLLPALITYLVLVIYPSFESIRLSFFDWKGFSKVKNFIGFHNYEKLISDKMFLSTLQNTIIILILGGLLIFLIAFIFSLFLNSGIKGKKIFRAVIFFPYIVAPVIHAIYWAQLVYAPGKGIINSFFKLIHINFLAEFTFHKTSFILYSVIFAMVWISVGFYVIILMAAIDRIPPYLIESARIEGANEFTIFFKITLPLIKDVLSVTIILWGIYAIKIFDFLYAYGGIEPPKSIWNSAIYLYVMGFGRNTPVFQLGYASAIGVILLIMIILFALLIRRLIIRREVYEY